jgi:predicted dehydrogenase
MAAMRIGLAGTGPWARKTYAPALAAHPGVEFAGVWGRRPEAATALAGDFGVPAEPDFDRLLERCDAVAFALPPETQAEYAVRAAEAGRHLLLDKPLAIEVSSARAVVDAADRAGVASAVLFTFRFREPTLSWIREHAGRKGWFTARMDWIASLFPVDGEGGPAVDSPWRREKGGLWDVGPHALSVLEPVLGEVSSVLSAVRGVGDTVHLTLAHEGGATSSVTVSLTAPAGAGGVDAVFRGSAGVATLPSASAETPAEALARAIDELLAAAGGSSGVAVCDARYALHVTEVLAAAEAAAQD